jgi:hypothetical protein
MAISCARCGHALRAGDSFCTACGMPVGGTAPQPLRVPWEYCVIREYVVQERGWFRPEVYALRAVAVGPKGTYIAGELFYKGTADYLLRSAQALTRLVMELTDDGWEPGPHEPQDRGDAEWPNYRFRRRVRS